LFGKSSAGIFPAPPQCLGHFPFQAESFLKAWAKSDTNTGWQGWSKNDRDFILPVKQGNLNGFFNNSRVGIVAA